MWFDDRGQVKCVRAERVGFRKGMYSIASVPDSAKWFDDLWSLYESDLPTAIRHLEEQSPSDDDLDVLALHVAFAAARYAGFTKSLMEWSRKQGMAISKAEAQHQRPAWIRAGLEIFDWRWRALHAPDGCPFVLPDTGYALIKKTSRDVDRRITGS